MLGKEGAIVGVKRFPRMKQSTGYDPGENFLYLVMQLILAGTLLAIMIFFAELMSSCAKRNIWRIRMYTVFGKI